MKYLKKEKDDLIQMVHLIIKLPKSKDAFIKDMLKKYNEDSSDFDAAITVRV